MQNAWFRSFSRIMFSMNNILHWAHIFKQFCCFCKIFTSLIMFWILSRVMNKNSCSTTFILVWSSICYLSFLSTSIQALLMYSFNIAWWQVFNKFFKLMLVKLENDWVNEIMMLMMIAWRCTRFFIEFN